jgi:monoterpene epsilon-lactone hydrolase
VHVGDDEMLLDDAVRFVERAIGAGVDARLEVWEGMVHGFHGSVGRLAAADEALGLVGEFLRERFGRAGIGKAGIRDQERWMRD